MADSTTQSIVVKATPETIRDVIIDFAAYPEWAGAVQSATVTEEYEDGYPSQVRFELDAGVAKDVYTLQYEYSEDTFEIHWHLTERSQLQKSQVGSYAIEDNGDGTSTVTYTLAVELGMSMLGMFKKKAEKMIIDTALKELQKRAESRA
ncbi:SRPBCC family protein [Longispora albida]|uniref:SRPBCC family protein n=1 Tax=Longispora albida TaxID=203523 RepID=UPI0003692CE0|nr:SRPBCC family protein [Longispora albida]